MEWEKFPFALPSPALSGSGSLGVISALNNEAPHCIYRYKFIKEILKCKKVSLLLKIFQKHGGFFQ